jgi:Protein of unknown function (DUF2726)
MGNNRLTENRERQHVTQSVASLPYRRRATLLTAGERRFYHQGLKPAVAHRYLISFKVRLADVIAAQDWESKHGRKIAQKHLDFVLVTPKQMRVVAAIELNDATHDSPDRQRRDDFLAQALQSAGIPLVTFPIYHRYDSEKIRWRILAATASGRHRRNWSAGR